MLDTVARYRTAMAEFAGMTNLDVWYSRLEIESVLEELAPLVHNLHLGNRPPGDAGRPRARCTGRQGAREIVGAARVMNTNA